MLPILSSPFRSLEPVNMFASLRRDVDRLFDEAWSGTPSGGWRTRGWLPPVDINETENDIEVQVEVPGMRGDDIDLTVENGILTISGEKRYERQEGSEEKGNLMLERQYGRFTRSFTLPAQVDAENVTAECADGILTIRLPKRTEARPKRISVSSSGERTRGQVQGGQSGQAGRGAISGQAGQSGQTNQAAQGPNAGERESRRTTGGKT
ncbi:MAG TPA: Hsp20/alpha crystallin family protein [Gemmatimonadaceae bacterium]|nr:Hsp20/alpha crystallin family protein [Gemmatimonadaceae bacterium]